MRRRGTLCAALAAGVVVAVVVLASSGVPQPKGRTSSAEPHISPTALRQFELLSAADTDVCQDMGNLPAIESYIGALSDGSRLQGSCCSPMDLGRYAAQVDDLKAYASIAVIPSDPYDLSKTLAQKLLGFYDHIQLDPAQRAIYDAAQSQTSDHGWCCCQCWAWYTHAGLAKDLITEFAFDAQQTAEVINLGDCCGG